MEKKDDEQKVTVATKVKELGATILDRVEVICGWLEEVRRGKSWAGKVVVGGLVTGVVTSLTEFGVMADVDGVPAVITNSQMGGLKVVVGQQVPGVVLYVDHGARVLELSFDPSLVEKITGSTGKAKTGVTMKGNIVFSRTEHSYQLVCVDSPGDLAKRIRTVSECSGKNVNIPDATKDVVEEEKI